MTFVTMLSFEVFPQIPHERRTALARLAAVLVEDGALDRADGVAVETTDKLSPSSSIFAISVQGARFAAWAYTQVRQLLTLEENTNITNQTQETRDRERHTERERDSKGDWLNDTFDSCHFWGIDFSAPKGPMGPIWAYGIVRTVRAVRTDCR